MKKNYGSLVILLILGACHAVPTTQNNATQQAFSISTTNTDFTPAMIVPEGKVATLPPPKATSANVLPFN